MAAVHDDGTADASYLVTLADTGRRTRVAGSEGAASPCWVSAGIAYCWANETWDDRLVPYFYPRRPTPHEVRVLAPSRRTPRTLYRSDDPLGCRTVVSP